jgi:hypothetical protein
MLADDRAGALVILGGLRHKPRDERPTLTPSIGEAPVATAPGDTDEDHELSGRLSGAQSALSRIVAWIHELLFDAEDLATLRAALKRL